MFTSFLLLPVLHWRDLALLLCVHLQIFLFETPLEVEFLCQIFIRLNTLTYVPNPPPQKSTIISFSKNIWISISQILVNLQIISLKYNVRESLMGMSERSELYRKSQVWYYLCHYTILILKREKKLEHQVSKHCTDFEPLVTFRLNFTF